MRLLDLVHATRFAGAGPGAIIDGPYRLRERNQLDATAAQDYTVGTTAQGQQIIATISCGRCVQISLLAENMP